MAQATLVAMDRQRQSTWIFLLAGIGLSLALATNTLGQNAAPPPSTDTLASHPNWRVLANTALLAAGVAAWSVPAGTLLAILLIRTDVLGRRGAMAAIVLLLFMPLYVQVAGWEAAIGKLGWLTRDTSRPFLDGMRGVIFVHALAALPWVVLIVSAGLQLVRREDEEVALLDASGPRVVARVVLPQIIPFILAAGLLVAIAATSEMTVTNLYLVDPGEYTLAEQVYMTLQSEPLATAVVQSWPSIGGTILLVVVGWWGVTALASLRGVTAADRRPPLIYLLGSWRWPATWLLWLSLAAVIGLPLLSLIYKAGTLVIQEGGVPVRSWSALKASTMPWTALWSVRGEVGWTVAFAAAAATLDVAVSLGIAWFIRTPAWRHSLAISLAAIAWAIPGPIVGLMIIAAMNHDVAGIGWLYQRTDVPTILAQAVRALPIVMIVVLQSLANFPSSTIEAAQLDGASRWSILVRIVIPQRRGALAAAWLAGFAIAAGDLAWSILVWRPGVDTLQRRLFGDIHSGADDRVAAICLAVSLAYAIGAAATLRLVRWRR